MLFLLDLFGPLSLFKLERLYHALCRLDWFFPIDHIDHIDHIPHTQTNQKMRTKEIKQIHYTHGIVTKVRTSNIPM